MQAIDSAGKTVAAMFFWRNESKRHAAEDALAADLTARGIRGVPAYTPLPNERREDAEAARASLKEAGANGVVVMRVMGEDQRLNYVEVTGPASNGNETPGSNNAAVFEGRYFDTLISVETLVYSLDRGTLLWASTSRTTNPKDLDSLVTEVADATAKEMVKQGLLARQ